MTRITFYKSNDVFYGFEEKGHTGYEEAGRDILCAAISSMTMLIINAIEVAYGSEADYMIDDETTDIKLIARSALSEFENDEKKRYAIAGLILAYYEQLKELMEEYYDYLSVDVVEKPLSE